MSEAITALEKSIQHWKENLAAESPHQVSTSAQNCALCMNYIDEHCMNCPIALHTGQRTCGNTPYISADKCHKEWEKVHERNGKDPMKMSVMAHTDAFKTARNNFRTHARDEVEFLEMLLLREQIKEGCEIQAP